MKKIALAALVFALSSATASAAVPCTMLSKTMTLGSTDVGTAGEVSRLQKFLGSTGFFSGASTGYFGPVTQSAVLSFQVAQGLEAVGAVGQQTRAAIAARSCAAVVSASSTPAASVAVVAPRVTSISPRSGKIGDTVRVKGSGFVSGALVLFGGGALRPTVDSSGSRLTFRVPEALVPECAFDRASPCSPKATPSAKGKYPVRVKTLGGESEARRFTLKNSATATTAGGATVSEGSSATTGSVNFLFPTVGAGASGGSSSSSGGGNVNFTFPTIEAGSAASSSDEGSTVNFSFPTVFSSSTGN